LNAVCVSNLARHSESMFVRGGIALLISNLGSRMKALGQLGWVAPRAVLLPDDVETLCL
jgi:hypothetical protein